MTKTLLMIAALLLSACISDPVTLSKSAEGDYNKAKLYIENEDYTKAVLFLEKFSAKYPYSKYAAPAELMRLESAYYSEQYVLSETLGLRFIDAHPDSKDRVYAQYLVAMSYYNQSSSAELDQQFSHQSLEAFLTLDEQFPNNPYATDIKKYSDILTNRVAEHEFTVGKFYFDRELYVASVNRFLFVKNNYLNASIADEALYYLAASYATLDQSDHAKATIALLQEKYPQSKWSKKAEEL